MSLANEHPVDWSDAEASQRDRVGNYARQERLSFVGEIIEPTGPVQRNRRVVKLPAGGFIADPETSKNRFFLLDFWNIRRFENLCLEGFFEIRRIPEVIGGG